MKKLIAIPVILSSVSLSLFAQVDSAKSKTYPIQYCAEMKDGIMVVMADRQEITSDVMTSDGTIIKPDGNVVKKDGITTTLKEGECIDAKGVLVDMNSSNYKMKAKNEETIFSDKK